MSTLPFAQKIRTDPVFLLKPELAYLSNENVVCPHFFGSGQAFSLGPSWDYELDVRLCCNRPLNMLRIGPDHT